MADDPEGMLSWDESVFRNEHVFEVDYLPETFHHRESQLESLKYALRPAVRGSRPLNTMIRGPPGTGKTTAIQKLFGELGGKSDIEVVRVNCQVDSTRYAVFSRLFEGVFEYEPPASGISFKKLFGQLTDRLVEEETVLVVALDDINYLFYENEAGDALYSLLRAHEVHSGAKIGVIVVSSDLSLDVIDDLDGRVQSVFAPRRSTSRATPPTRSPRSSTSASNVAFMRVSSDPRSSIRSPSTPPTAAIFGWGSISCAGPAFTPRCGPPGR